MVCPRGGRVARLDTKQIRRGELWTVDLRPTIGWEIAKKRPALIISSDQINSESPLVIIIPVSSKIPQITGFEKILLGKKESNLEKDSVILVNQIRTVDKTRLGKKIGHISEGKLEEVEDALKLVLGLLPLDI